MLTNAEIWDLHDKISDLKARIANLTEVMDGYKAQLREAVKVGERLENGDRSISVRQATRFDPVLALKVCSPEQIAFATVTESRIDEAKLKAIIPPAAFEACRSPKGKASIYID